MPLQELRVLGPCRVFSRITWLRRDGQSSTPDSSRLSHSSSNNNNNNNNSHRARGLLLSSPVRSLMALLRFIRAMRSSLIIISRLLCILVNTVVPRLRCPGPMAARHLRLILASTVDLRPSLTLQPGYSSSNHNHNQQDESPLTHWSKTWTECASAPLLLRRTQVYLVLLLQMVTPMKSKAVLHRWQQQEWQLELEPR